MIDLTGKSIGRYQIIESLGEGGMAIVYKGFDTLLEREVAIKIIRTDLFGNAIIEQILKRFEREAKSMARLSHANIVKVLDYGDYEGNPYLVMELLHGGTLKQRMGTAMPYREAVRLLEPIARALAYAHSKGILHRDVKPSNILITENGEPILTDFGIAKLLDAKEGLTLTGTGMGVGTPEYMAPEQGLGREVDARADVYALGIALYELVTGRTPYTANTPMEILLKQVNEPLPSPTEFVRDLPAEVEQILIKALAKNPEDRFGSMAEMAEAMDHLLHGEVDRQPTPPAIPMDERTVIGLPEPPAVVKNVEKPTELTPVPPVVGVVEQLTRVTPVPQAPPPSAGQETYKAPRAATPRRKIPLWAFLAGGAGLIALVLVVIGVSGGFKAKTLVTAPTITPTWVVVNVPTQSSGVVAGATVVPTEILATANTPPAAAINCDVPLDSSISGKLTIWYVYQKDTGEETVFFKNVEIASQFFPNLDITLEQVPLGEIDARYRSSVAAGAGPDMFIAPNDDLGDEVRDKLIADISGMAAEKLACISQEGIDGMSVDGRLYGVPESLKAVVLWYNKELLPTPPTTTNELQTLMQNGTPVSINFDCYFHYGFFGAFGGRIFDDSWNVVADQSAGMTDALNYLYELYKLSKDRGWPIAGDEALTSFQSGKTAAITNGNWEWGNYKNTLGEKLAVAPLPAGPAGPATPLLGVDGFYINPNNPNQEAALELALYLTNQASQTLMMNYAGHVPVRTDVEINDPLIKQLVDAFNTGNNLRPQEPEMSHYWQYFCSTDDVFVNGVPVADWLRTATANANQ